MKRAEKKPNEIQFPPEKPEITKPEEEPTKTWPSKEREINPGTEPTRTIAPSEVPPPPSEKIIFHLRQFTELTHSSHEKDIVPF